MTEKYVLREAVRDVITDTVYKRQKHPFLSPPATLNPDQTFNIYVQDMLRGKTMASIPYFDQKEDCEHARPHPRNGRGSAHRLRPDSDAARQHVCSAQTIALAT